VSPYLQNLQNNQSQSTVLLLCLKLEKLNFSPLHKWLSLIYIFSSVYTICTQNQGKTNRRRTWNYINTNWTFYPSAPLKDSLWSNKPICREIVKVHVHCTILYIQYILVPSALYSCVFSQWKKQGTNTKFVISKFLITNFKVSNFIVPNHKVPNL